MTYAQAIAYIQQWIIDNNNKEITAAIMRDVLENMLLYARDSIGEVQLLEEGDNVVEAVNILFGMFDSLEVNLPIDVHTGVDDPNVTPPDNFNAPDFYIRNENQTYIYTGTSWVLIQDSSTSTTPSLELVVQQGNTTSLPIVGTDYFLDKSDNDFAQIKDIQDSSIYNLTAQDIINSTNAFGLVSGELLDFITQGRNIELRVDDASLQWRLEGNTTWNDLFDLNQLRPQFRVINGVFESRRDVGSPWQELIDFNNAIPIPTIGVNGNWFIGGVDTGVSAQALPTTKYDDDIIGLRDGVNNVFTISDSYVSGTLNVYLDGSRISKGNNKDYIEYLGGAQINRIITPQSLLIFDYIKD